MVDFSGYRKPVDIVFTFLASVTLISGCVFIPMMIYLRHKQPIKARPLWVVISSQILMIMFIIAACFQRLFSYTFPCIATVIFTHAVFVAAIALYMLRVWLVWYAYKSAHEKSKLFTLDINELREPIFAEEGNWYLRHRYLASNKFLRWACFILLSAVCGPILLTFAIWPEIKHETVDVCPSNAFAQMIVNAWTGGCAIIVIIAAFKFVPLKDAFCIKAELRVCGFATGIALPLWMYITQTDFNNEVFPLSTVILVMVGLLCHISSTGYPIWKTRDQTLSPWRYPLTQNDINATASKSWYSRKIPQNLTELLTNEREVKNFMVHLIEAFCVENLIFYRACEQFERIYDDLPPEEMRKEAEKINYKFVTENSVLQVNLSYKNINIIKEALDTDNPVPVSMFEGAKNEVFVLMERDSFVRYVLKRQEEVVEGRSMRQRSHTTPMPSRIHTREMEKEMEMFSV